MDLTVRTSSSKRLKSRTSFKKRNVTRALDSVVITEEPHKGVQCLMSPPPQDLTALMGQLLDSVEDSTFRERTNEITIRAIERFLRLDSYLKHKSIAEIVHIVQDETLSNLQVVKKMRRYFPERIVIWQGLSIYIMKCKDPSNSFQEKQRRRGSGPSSAGTDSVTTSTTFSALPTMADFAELPESERSSKLDESKNSCSSSVPEGGLNINLSRHLEETDDKSDSEEKVCFSPNTEPSEQSKEEGSNKPKTFSKFIEIALRVKTAVEVIRRMVKAARMLRESSMNDVGDDDNDDYMRYIFKTHWADDSHTKLDDSSSEHDPDDEEPEYEWNSAWGSIIVTYDEQGNEYSVRKGPGGKLEYLNKEGLLIVDATKMAQEHNKLYDEDGKEILDIFSLVAVSETEVDESQSMMSLLSKGTVLSNMDIKPSVEKVLSSQDHTVETAVTGYGSAKRASDDDEEMKRIAYEEIHSNRELQKIKGEPVQRQGEKGRFQDYQGITSKEDYLARTNEKQNKVSEDDKEMERILSDKTVTTSDNGSEWTTTGRELYFNWERTDCISVRKAIQVRFYDQYHRRYVRIPGRCAQWDRMVDEENREVINVYGKRHSDFKIYDEDGIEVVDFSDAFSHGRKMFDGKHRQVVDRSNVPGLYTVEKDFFKKQGQEQEVSREPSFLTDGTQLPVTVGEQMIEKRHALNSLLSSKETTSDQPGSVLDESTSECNAAKTSRHRDVKQVARPHPAEPWADCPTTKPVAPDAKLEVKSYLEKHGINQMFEMFLNNLVLEKPTHPIDYLINLVHKIRICQRKTAHMEALITMDASRNPCKW